jgi:hypothetical protein
MTPVIILRESFLFTTPATVVVHPGVGTASRKEGSLHTGGSQFGHTSGAMQRYLCARTVISDPRTAPTFLSGHRPVPGCSQLPLYKQQHSHRTPPLQTAQFLETIPRKKIVRREFSKKFEILEKHHISY